MNATVHKGNCKPPHLCLNLASCRPMRFSCGGNRSRESCTSHRDAEDDSSSAPLPSSSAVVAASQCHTTPCSVHNAANSVHCVPINNQFTHSSRAAVPSVHRRTPSPAPHILRHARDSSYCDWRSTITEKIK